MKDHLLGNEENAGNINNQGSNFLQVIKEEKRASRRGGIYQSVQIELTYHSNCIEGNRLSIDQTRFIYETNTIDTENEVVNVDDIIETVNHFRCIDLIIDKAEKAVSETIIKELHRILKTGTKYSRKSWFAVGEYKKLPNEVGLQQTANPEEVPEKMKQLLKRYNSKKSVTFDDLLEFHHDFESIHPFQDGNGRVGRLLLFKECLRHEIVPFIIDENLKLFYYRGLREWKNERGYLRDTCLTAQDSFKIWLKYFRVPFKDG